MFKEYLDKAINKFNSLPNKRIVVLLTIGVIAIVFTFFFNKFLEVQARKALFEEDNTQVTAAAGEEAELRSKMMEAQQEMGNEFYNQASGGEGGANQPNPQMQPPQNPNMPQQGALSAIPPNLKAKQADKYVTLKVVNFGKTNPFEPYVDIAISASNPMYDLPAPPTALMENPQADELMKTTISGIMYDAFSPSAIVSVNGQDHLVRKGDKINGYKILNITRDRVVVQNGTNVYRATVGETLMAQGTNVNFNDVYNLPNKFGGSRGRSGNMIYINSLN